MSIQASGWAIEQSEVPARPALVLIALANHASHVDGRCWPSIDTIALEARCSRRAVFGYLAALERNGYVEIVRTRKKSGRQGVNNYFLIFNRQANPWSHFHQEPDPEPPISPEDVEAIEDIEAQDVAARVQIPHPGNEPPECKASAPGQSATVCTPHVMPEPSDSRTLEQVEGRAALASAGSAPPSYRPQSRTERAASTMAVEDTKPKRYPVFVGSEPWNYWVKRGHPPDLSSWIEVNGKRCRGWYFPSLFPPPAKGPGDRTTSPNTQASPENEPDLSEFSREMGG